MGRRFLMTINQHWGYIKKVVIVSGMIINSKPSMVEFESEFQDNSVWDFVCEKLSIPCKNLLKLEKIGKRKFSHFEYFLNFEEVRNLRGFAYESAGRPFESGWARQ